MYIAQFDIYMLCNYAICSVPTANFRFLYIARKISFSMTSNNCLWCPSKPLVIRACCCFEWPSSERLLSSPADLVCEFHSWTFLHSGFLLRALTGLAIEPELKQLLEIRNFTNGRGFVLQGSEFLLSCNMPDGDLGGRPSYLRMQKCLGICQTWWCSVP